MTRGYFGSLLILLAGAALAPAQTPAAPERLPDPQPVASSAGKDAAPAPAANKAAAPAESGIGIPWNPPVGHANVWPHDEPLQAGDPDCGPPGDFWLVPEYLLWGIKGFHEPPLATTGPAAGGGVLGRSGTTVLGGPNVENEAFSGGRFTAGTWLNDDHTCGFEGSYFFVGEQTDHVDASSTGGPGSPVLARPFTNVLTGQPAAFLVAGPGVGLGTVRTSASSALQGARGDLVYQCYCCPPWRIELRAGFRYQDLAEKLEVDEAGMAALRPERQVFVFDQFHTRNRFFGGELGTRAEYCWGPWVGTIATNLALGSNQETIHVVGTTLETTRRKPVVLNGGLLALPSNAGPFHNGDFSAIPELDLQLGYQFNPYVRAFVGYSFLSWSDVARPGDQVDLGVNPGQVPALRGAGRFMGPARPAFSLQETDFWAQGLSVGAEIRY
jgi:hypothetical protein